ncbi:MAG: iron-containing alcohol dehydrogenase [Dehalococcoidales bacterium]
METMSFSLPTNIIIGVGVLKKLGPEAAKSGKKAIIVTYPEIRQAGILDKVIADLEANGVQSVVFDKVQPNPHSATIDKGAVFAREQKIDLVIGLGGGSAMDSAKGIAAAFNGTVPVWDYVEGKAKINLPLLPIIQVPTMAGTGSEINAGSVITNWETHIKSPLYTALARVAIIDPENTLTVPLKQIKAGGFDIFTHVAEQYISDPAPEPLTDGIRETIMKIVVQNLPKAIAKPNDIEARSRLTWASTVAMSILSRLGGGGGAMTCHSIEHALSGYYDVTHGEGLAALFPAWMEYHRHFRQERIKSMGNNVFGEKDGIIALEKWLQSVGMRLRLGDIGCEIEKTEMITDLVLRSSPPIMLAGAPVPIGKEAIIKIYRESF